MINITHILGGIMNKLQNCIGFLCMIVILFVITACDTEKPTEPGGIITWEKTFGGTDDDRGRSVQETSGGGYIIAGETSSFGAGSADVYLIKTDAQGQKLWSKTFGGINNDFGYSFQEITGGGYIIAGWTSSFGAGGFDVYLIKTDAEGQELWSKTFGGISVAYSVQETSDGGYIIAGWTSSFGVERNNVYLIKTDAQGQELWNRTFGGISVAYSVQETSDGGYIIAGWTSSFGVGGFDVYLIKTDAQGQELWNQTFGGTNNDFGYSVQETTGGGYIIAGETSSFGAGSADVYLIKTDTQGQELWSKTFGGTNNDFGYSVQETIGGGYIIAGETSSFGAGGFDVYLIKTDAQGQELWSKTFGGTDDDRGRSVQETTGDGYIIAGETSSSFSAGGFDVYLIKTDAQGNTN